MQQRRSQWKILEGFNILVTVDPVNKLGTANPRAKPEPLPNEDFFKKVRNSVGMWINIHAIGDGREDTIGDRWARIGGPWGTKPRKHAHLFISSPHHHEYFDSMLGYKPSTNELSAEEILNMLK